jgi:hypothetical protein
VVPAGTATVKLVDVAAETVALTAPKYTMLFAAAVLNPVPVIVTVVPTGPLVGEKLVIVGTCAKATTLTITVKSKLNNLIFFRF